MPNQMLVVVLSGPIEQTQFATPGKQMYAIYYELNLLSWTGTECIDVVREENQAEISQILTVKS